ncbi:GntR family transcriptional regulator [Streptomyces sp. NPDC057638]|uniref:GntR family transcriptional regulator n=1 Tax=Streptomyces sp. NPDC057638 TaxID=3346190 RepID=UPI003689BE07
MSLPTNDPRPPYLLAADRLREEITSGRLKPGDRLPSSRELRDSLGIANATVHSALRVLRDDGLIYSVHGRGSYVSDPAAQAANDPLVELATTFVSDFAEQEGKAPAESDSPLTDILLTVRDQLHAMAAQVQDLKGQVTALEAKVERLEREAGH